jgi:hypothetical protein
VGDCNNNKKFQTFQSFKSFQSFFGVARTKAQARKSSRQYCEDRKMAD